MKLILTTATAALLAATTIPASAFDINLHDDHDVTTTTTVPTTVETTVPTTQKHVAHVHGTRSHEPYYSAADAVKHPRSISDLAGPAHRVVTVTHGTKTVETAGTKDVSTTVTCHTVIHVTFHGVTSETVCN